MAVNNIVLEGCRLIFRNLAGAEKQYNPAGQRNFGVILDPDMAEQLKADGWNIKELKPREEGELPIPWIKVKLNYGTVTPNVYMISGKKKTLLTEDTVGTIDYAEIENVDLIIRPYTWNINGRDGITAYVKNMYVTIAQDEFAAKYDFEDDAEIPF